MLQASYGVPNELVEHIIHFNHEDAATLMTCSRVARAWVQATRCHLFANVNLKTTRRILAFSDILQSSPYIARNVRSAQIPAWLNKSASLEALSRIFEQLHSVKSISCVGPQLQPVWYEVLGELPSVRSLKLCVTWPDLHALNELLCAMPGLTDLFVETDMSSGLSDPSEPSFRIVPLPCLERMIVFNAKGLPNDYQSILLKQDLPCLESIEAQFGSAEDVAFFCRFLRRGGYKTLKDLHIEFTYSCPEGPMRGAC
ncbi:hypothetical protein DAEQUDRAFT_765512 [Daedalea quercina L-15889]|uniref:F-box domain-containing protein n=1 Tax=Daedalea quercina L-15889 TaxID=1314783 RepID=A0A165QGC3_9APHY|nr:hypothetical protein DAEQUDRAFT_765512 [Daedalea quercina L-15889]